MSNPGQFTGGWTRQKKHLGEGEYPIPADMIEFQMKLANGATFTRLKPGVARGAETAETWKSFYKSPR